MKLSRLFGVVSTLTISFLTKVLAESSKQIININYDIDKGGPTVYEVENNALLNINFKHLDNKTCRKLFQSNGITDSDPNCEWFLGNEKHLEDKNFIKLLNSSYNQTSEMFNFQFDINNVTSKDVFPFLVFNNGVKKNANQYYILDMIPLRLKLSDEIDVDFDDVFSLRKDTKTKKIDVVKDDVVEINIHKYSKQVVSPDNLNYHWYLENVDEIRSSNAIEPLNLLENGRTSDVVDNLRNFLDNNGGEYDVFKFKITGEDPSQFTLTFVLLDHISHEPVAKAIVIMKLYGYEKEIIMKEIEYTVSMDEKNQVVEVENNSVVTFHVKNASELCNPQKYSECKWYFIKGDLDNYAYLDYLGDTYSKEKDTYDFKFKIENLTLADVLPNLEFNYGSVSPSQSDFTPDDSITSVRVHLANVGQVNLKLDYSIYDFMEEPVRADIYVKRNSIIQIQFNKICSSTSGREYHWYFSNFTLNRNDINLEPLNIDDESRAKGSIKDNQFPLPPDSCADEVFKFRVKERATDTFPLLYFTHHEEGKLLDFRYVYVVIKMEPEVEEEPLKELDVYYDNEKTVYDIEEGTYILNVHIKSLTEKDCLDVLTNLARVVDNDSMTSALNNPQCKWHYHDLTCMDKQLHLPETLVEYYGRNYNQKTDTFIFKFKVNNLAPYSSFPYIFLYYGPSQQIDRVYKEMYFKPLRLHFALPGQKEIKFDDLEAYSKEPGKKEVIVHKNDVVHVYFASASKYRWFLMNSDTIDNSTDIQVYDRGSLETNPFWADECCEEYVYDIVVTDTAKAETLPGLSFAYFHRFALNNGDNNPPRVELILKLEEKNEEEKEKEENESLTNTFECPVKSYSCCSKPNTKVHYHDDEGDWGVENHQWCYISTGKKLESEEEEEEEEDQCRKDIGYPCCRKTHTVAYTDDIGPWGIEDDHWCMLTISMDTCQPVDGYPLCTSTQTAVYVDTLQWGVENNKWCIICS